MTKHIPGYLKLVNESSPELLLAEAEDLAPLGPVLQAFEQLTGWKLHYERGGNASSNSNLSWSAPADPGVGASPGLFRILSDEQTIAAGPRVALKDATHLAAALVALWNELLATRHALWQREAELATGIPLTAQIDEPTHLAERLEAVLRGGAQAVECHAAALYLLDPGTTELKLRSSWGLPQQRFIEPARPLRGALADLEALLGHAVVLTGDEPLEHWKVPEDFAAAVCVPVASASMPLGTMWVFSRRERDFSDAQTNLLEVVAGRLAADLEREVLLHNATAARAGDRQRQALERSWQHQLPRIAPLVEGWDVAGRAVQSGPIGGAFYDWFAGSGGSLATVLAVANKPAAGGAMIASALRGVARAQAAGETAHGTLDVASSVLWSGSGGEEQAAMLVARLRPLTDTIHLSYAGPLRAMVIGSDTVSGVDGCMAAVGAEEDPVFFERGASLRPGEVLLVYGITADRSLSDEAEAELESALLAIVQSNLRLRADVLAELASQALQKMAGGCPTTDGGLLVIKRSART